MHEGNAMIGVSTSSVAPDGIASRGTEINATHIAGRSIARDGVAA